MQWKVEKKLKRKKKTKNGAKRFGRRQIRRKCDKWRKENRKQVIREHEIIKVMEK
jgi:hypothetical protein